MIHFLENSNGVFHIYIFVKAGVIYEDDDKQGISHMLEHMMFKRSQHMNSKEILREATKIGGGFNASTDKDVTYYYFKTTTEWYATAIKIFCEILTMPNFTAKDLEAERHVVLEEMNKGMDDDDRTIWHLSTLSVLDETNPYCKKVIGTEQTLLSITVKDLNEYFTKRYKNYVIVINCEKKIQHRVQNMLESRFKNYIKREEVSCELVPEETQRKIIVINKPLNQTNIIISYPLFTNTLNVQSALTLELISFVLSGAGLYSLLTYELREKRGLIYNVSTYNENMRHLTIFRISLSSTSRDVKLIIALILRILKSLKTVGLSNPDKLAFFKNSFITAFKLNMSSDEYKTLLFGTHLFYTNNKENISEHAFLNVIKGITNNDIMQISRQLFDATNAGVVCVGPLANVQNLADDLLTCIGDK